MDLLFIVFRKNNPTKLENLKSLLVIYNQYNEVVPI